MFSTLIEKAIKVRNDLVILLPGILGSVLADASGKEIWAPNAGAIWRLIASGGGSIENLVVPADGRDDGIRATRLVPDATVIPGFMKIDGYTRIQRDLCEQLGMVDGEDFRAFPYDWRLDNVVAAERLKLEALEWLEQWRERSGNPDARLVLIAHSMGGLIARYFVECLGGWSVTRRLITLGTPHRGAPAAAGFLVNGMKKGYGPMGIDLSPMLRSCPSVYQLLPLYPCVGGHGAELRIVEAVERSLLPHIDPESARHAVAFHQRIADSVAANALNPVYAASGYEIVPVIGVDQATVQAIVMQADIGVLLKGFGDVNDDGDGTVPRGSATPLELHGKGREMYAAEAHGSLQNNDSVLVNLRSTITALAIDWRRFLSAADKISVRLDFDDLVVEGEPLRVRARPDSENVKLRLKIEQLPGGASGNEALAPDAEAGWFSTTLKLPVGTWRLTVVGEGVSSVSNLLIVGAL